MNFLSSAFSSLTGTAIPYTFLDRVVEPLTVDPDSGSIWTVYNGTNPKTDLPVSIFEFNVRDPALARFEPLARNCFRKLKLVRFPQVIAAVDFIDNEQFLYIVTEQVVPLAQYLDTAGDKMSLDAKLFGINNVVAAMLLVNSKARCLHARLDIQSVFVNAQGEWKLFGFELLTNLDSDPDQPVYRLLLQMPGFTSNLPAEVSANGIEAIRPFPIKFDSYRLAVFIYAILTASRFAGPVTVEPAQLASSPKVPKQLSLQLKRLASVKPNLRVSVEKFAQETALFFEAVPLVAFNSLLDDIKFQNDGDKLVFFKNDMAHYIDGVFPPGYLDNKLLPEITTQFSNLIRIKPTVNSTPEQHQQRQETLSVLLNHILKLSTNLDDTVFSKVVKPVIFQCFTLQDRSIRLTLLHHLPSYAERLTEAEVQSKVFYNLVTGFQDTNFMIRESTLTLITTVVDKVSVKQLNQDLLKILAKLQMDPKPSIRTNTLILIIKISSKIYANSRNSVVITALAKSLRDSFTPCKLTALQGFEKLIDQFSLDEICGKILGHLAISLMDGKSSKVRQEAKRIFQLYLGSVEKHAASLPDDEENEDEEEKEFFKRFAPTQKNEEETETTGADALGGALSFGWNVVNKFVSSSQVEGEIDKSFNRSTPDLTRVSSPTVQETKPPPAPIAEDWNDDVLDGNDGWGDGGFDSEPEVAPPAPKPSMLAARSRPAATSTRTLKLAAKKPAKSPGSSLKLNLEPEITDDDGWGGDDW